MVRRKQRENKLEGKNEKNQRKKKEEREWERGED